MTEPIDFALNAPDSGIAALADWLALPPIGQTAWLLVDASSYGPQALAHASHELGWTIQSAFGAGPLAIYGEHAPHLIALTPAENHLPERLVQFVHGRNVPAYSGFVSSASLGTLQTFFAYWGHASVDAELLYCRFADTRLLPALLAALKPAQAARAASIITEWRWVDHRGSVGIWLAPEKGNDVRTSSAEDQEKSIQLSGAQFSTMLRAAEPDAMFAQLLDAVPSLVPSIERGAFRDRINAALVAADALGVEGNPDRLQFLILTLTCGDGFHNHPSLYETWNAVRSGVISLSDAMRQWPPSLWVALQAKGTEG